MKVYNGVLEMIGKTPMLRVSKLDTGSCELFLKLELANPGGSIKDRIGITMADVVNTIDAPWPPAYVSAISIPSQSPW